MRASMCACVRVGEEREIECVVGGGKDVFCCFGGGGREGVLVFAFCLFWFCF